MNLTWSAIGLTALLALYVWSRLLQASRRLDALLARDALQQEREGGGYTTPGRAHCRCDWLGAGTPEHDASPLCIALRPDADRDEEKS